jgi:signal transduction histidine kinase
VSRWFRRRPIRVRITLAFLAAMALLLLASGAFIYERMQFALDRSIRDVPKGERAEIAARRRHRNEALDELLAQLAVAYGVTVAVAGFVGYRMTRAALDPVESMQRQASAPRAPGSRVRLDVPETDDELSRLAQTLNTLLASTERAVERERRFIADASHELRTPLSLLKLHIDLALSRDRPRGELRYALERAGADTDRLIRLANNLLLIAQADEGTLELAPVRVDVREALAEAAARVAEPARASGSAIHVPPRGDGTAVAVDPERLQQALTNLLDNALRHGDGDVKLSWRRSGDRAEIHVEDAGRGFAPEFVARAFDRFATTSESRTAGGAGLGLSIAKAIAEAHGGSARAVNGEHGADVSLSLPLAE